MTEQTLVLILAILVGLCAIALLVQVICLIAIYGVVRRAQKISTGMTAKINELVRVSKEAVAENKRTFAEIKAESMGIASLTRTQLARLDSLYSDVMVRFLNQKDRAELILDDAIRRVTEPVNVVRRGIITPARQLQGVVMGVLNAVATMRRRFNAVA